MSKAGTKLDPGPYTNVSLTDFRDFADYIHYFCPTIGSATDGIGTKNTLGKAMLNRDEGNDRAVRLTYPKVEKSAARPGLSHEGPSDASSISVCR